MMRVLMVKEMTNKMMLELFKSMLDSFDVLFINDINAIESLRSHLSYPIYKNPVVYCWTQYRQTPAQSN